MSSVTRLPSSLSELERAQRRRARAERRAAVRRLKTALYRNRDERYELEALLVANGVTAPAVDGIHYTIHGLRSLARRAGLIPTERKP